MWLVQRDDHFWLFRNEHEAAHWAKHELGSSGKAWNLFPVTPVDSHPLRSLMHKVIWLAANVAAMGAIFGMLWLHTHVHFVIAAVVAFAIPVVIQKVP